MQPLAYSAPIGGWFHPWLSAERKKGHGVITNGERLQLGQPLVDLALADLEVVGFDPDARARQFAVARIVLDGAQIDRLQAGERQFGFGDAPGEVRVLGQRPPARHLVLGRDALQLAQQGLVGAEGAARHPLVRQQVLGDAPAPVDLADGVFHRHADIGEDHVIGLVQAVHQHDRPDLDSRRLQVHEDEADALLLAPALGRADQQETPVGPVRLGGPDLGAVDHPIVPVAHRARAQRGEVGARLRLGIALAPDMLGREHRRQEAALLCLRAEGHQHRPAHVEAEGNQTRRPGEAQFFIEDIFSGQRPTGPAVLLRPVWRDPALLVKNPVPADHVLAAELDPVLDLVAELVRQGSGQEGADLLVEGLVGSLEADVHGPGPPARWLGRGRVYPVAPRPSGHGAPSRRRAGVACRPPPGDKPLHPPP